MYCMENPDTVRLAELIVSALGVGIGKREHDVIDEIFRMFRIDFDELDRSVPVNTRNRAVVLRAVTAPILASAAGSPVVLINSFIRCGGRFITMVDEVYRRLAMHTATTAGTSQEFRIERSGVDESQLTISAAMIEEVRRLAQQFVELTTGRFQQHELLRFCISDGGQFFGRWPIDGDGLLLDSILHLPWVRDTWLASHDEGPLKAQLVEALSTAMAAGDALTTTAESLVSSYMASLDAQAHMGTEEALAEVSSDEIDDWIRSGVVGEVERFRATGLLGTLAVHDMVTKITQNSTIGVDRDLATVVIDEPEFPSGGGIGQLAGFVAQHRTGRWSSRTARIQDILDDPHQALDWLVWLRKSAQEAAAWLREDAMVPVSTVPRTEMVEIFEQFLNLPLWQARELLYEIWVLCSTLDACEAAGWTVDLALTADSKGVWILGRGAGSTPVATIFRPDDTMVRLDVWREPDRQGRLGKVTPDVTIATPEPLVLDLLVVEAKDKLHLSVGPTPGKTSGPEAARSRALDIGLRYAENLGSRVTWVCNHCDFKIPVAPDTNYGNAWQRVHLADHFRPGSIPAEFERTVSAALATLTVGPANPRDGRAGLLLVVDRTSSMGHRAVEAFDTLRQLDLAREPGLFRAVLYIDHADDEPYLVAKVGPMDSFDELAAAVVQSRTGHGHDFDEALEDALLRCCEIIDDIGPQLVVILTDAGPHPVDECPYAIDFVEQLEHLLAVGCRVHVANDWGTPEQIWEPFAHHDGFRLGGLASTPRRL